MMKKSVLMIVLMFTLLQINGQTNRKFIDRQSGFSPNEIAYVFGDNVKLRKSFSTNSEELGLLKIASEIQILEKKPETHLYNGINWNWYKVSYQNKIGYIIGGLISLDTQKIGDSKYLVSLKKVDEDKYKILTRVLNKNGKYLENIESFGTEHGFTFEVYDNRGVANIENMVMINYHAEACGVNGGGYYLFNDGNSFKKAVDLYEMSEAGLFGSMEEVIFPDDKEGIKDKIIFKRESIKYVDESNNRSIKTIEMCEFVWEGKELVLELLEEE